MRQFWNKFDGMKTNIGAGIAFAGLCCATFGAPVAISGAIGIAGGVLTLVGRLHAGAKLADQQGQIIELVNQVKAIREGTK
jgi:hypothetical protein